MKRTAALFLTFFILLLTLCSCRTTSSDASCQEVLRAMTNAEISLPAGKYYGLSAPEGDEKYLSDDLISSLFGGGSYPKIAEDWIDCALYLSYGKSPCEFAVILCQSRDVAHDTAALLQARLSAIRLTKSSPEYAQMLENASITLIGNYALLIISSDTETALREAKRAIR